MEMVMVIMVVLVIMVVIIVIMVVKICLENMDLRFLIEESPIPENALRCENMHLTPSLPQHTTSMHIWPGCDGLEIRQVVHTVDKDKLKSNVK